MRKCTVGRCEGKHYADGKCQTHYQRWYRTGDVGPEERIPPGRKPGLCSLPGCTRKHKANGMCNPHYRLTCLYGDPLATKRTKDHPASPKIWADLRSAEGMRAHNRRKDVDFYLARAETHGRPLTKGEREFSEGVRMAPDRERDTAQLAADVQRLTAQGLGAEEVGKRLGVTSRTVVRYRVEQRKENDDE